MWDTWEPQILEKIIKRHSKVNAHLKAQGKKKGYVICVLVDDFADQGERVMHSATNVLTSLFVRGRHLGCSCWLLTQKLKVQSLIIRTTFCWVLCWRLRSAVERDQLLGELDALLDRRVLMQMYLKVTEEKHSFWFINLLNEQDSMWFKNFEHKMLLIDKDGSQAKTSTSAGRHERSGASGAQSSGHG